VGILGGVPGNGPAIVRAGRTYWGLTVSQSGPTSAPRQPSLVWSASLFLGPSLETIHTGSKYTNLPLQLTDLVRGAFHALLQSS
jgi:hypothetical protein